MELKSTMLKESIPGYKKMLSISSKDKTEDNFFKDNLDHLQALEYEAKLRLTLAYLRNSKSGFKQIKREKHQKDEKISPADSYFDFLKLPMERISVNEVEALLKKVEAEYRKKTKNSICRGIRLNFEQFCESYGLDYIERLIVVLMFSNNTGPSFRNLYELFEIDSERHNDGRMGIEAILLLISCDYRDQINNRKYFSIDTPLIREEIILTWGNFDNTTNILEEAVFLHERVVRYILGDDNVYDISLRCITKEPSNVDFDQVILPKHIKKDITKLISNYSNHKVKREKSGIGEFYGYGTGLSLLFFGPSGTGKTMLAKGLAYKLNKPLLSLNIETANKMDASLEDIFKYLFKEAKLTDGIVFLDECDDLFKNDSSNSRELLIEIEKSDCMTILATNKPISLDPSLDRRIMMKVRFEIPGEEQRERIWKALKPDNITLSKDVNFKKLAKDYIFTGGLVKNIWLMAINNSIEKNGNSKIIVTAKEIEKAASYQAINAFELNGFGHALTPKVSINQLPVKSQNKKELYGVTEVYKKIQNKDVGINLLLGTSDIQTGIDVAGSIALECNLKLKIFSISEVLLKSDKIKKDPITQNEISMLDYAFKSYLGPQSATLFVDYNSSLKGLLSKCDENKSNDEIIKLNAFLDRLRNFHGLLFVVTTPIGSLSIPVEFQHCIEIKFPPEEHQLNLWKQHLKDKIDNYDDLVNIVERWPMHLREIDYVAQQAEIRSLIKGGHGKFTLDDLCELIKNYRKTKATPILFGNKSGAFQR